MPVMIYCALCGQHAPSLLAAVKGNGYQALHPELHRTAEGEACDGHLVPGSKTGRDEIDRLPQVVAAFEALGGPLWHADPLDPHEAAERPSRLKLYRGAVAKLTIAKLKINLSKLGPEAAADEIAEAVVFAEEAAEVLARCVAEHRKRAASGSAA